MKIIISIALLLTSFLGFSQDYFSRIIPTEDNPLIKQLILDDNRYLISTDFFNFDGVFGGLIIVTEDGDEKVKFDNMDLGLSPILLLDNSLYLVGENPLNQGDSTLFLGLLDANTLDLEWIYEYSSPVMATVNTTLKNLNDELFILNVNNAGTDFINQRELMITKTNLVGQEIAKYTYNRDKRTTYGYELFNSSDSNLLLSTIFSKQDGVIGTFSQVLKINQQGEVLWNYEGTEKLDNGAVPTWAIELSDSSILQTYYVDRRGEVDYITNNWYPEPNKFIWLSKYGEWIKDKTIITDKEDFILYYGLKRGKGDYFYAYGYYEDRRPAIYDQFYGHLTKFTNEGDTIWSRNYQHPTYPDGNIVHNIKDILEEENGDITILADITPPAAKTEVWLFKVDSEGCFVNEACEDMTTMVSTSDVVAKVYPNVYPNPTSGLIHLEWPTVIEELVLLDAGGKVLLKQKVNSAKVDLDMSAFEKGMYMLQILHDARTRTTRRVVKH